MTQRPPLVSCIMPTADRRPFVERAVEQFLAQTYERRELVVVDDGVDDVADLMPADDRVRYHRLPARAVLGAKRNLACEMAEGSVLVHWDDDDWMAPWRVAAQVEALESSGAEVTGLRSLLFHDEAHRRAFRYTYPPSGTRPWVAGATMAYRREFWEAHRFPELRNGEDTRFLWSHRPRLHAHTDDSWYVATIHPGNTSVKRPSGTRWQTVPLEEVHRRMGTTATHPYTPAWRRAVRSGVRSSAAALVPLLAETFSPRTAVDVGAGEGWFVKEMQAAGVDATGVDGPWVEGVEHVDLTAPPYPDLGRFDLALCLEVAEHVPAVHAGALVDWLASLAPVVVFSAAVPGQGGSGHVNEQWPGDWAQRFEQAGMPGTGALRWRVWDDDRISWWYRQNLMVFGDLGDLVPDGCPAVVHPGMWTWHRRS